MMFLHGKDFLSKQAVDWMEHFRDVEVRVSQVFQHIRCGDNSYDVTVLHHRQPSVFRVGERSQYVEKWKVVGYEKRLPGHNLRNSCSERMMREVFYYVIFADNSSKLVFLEYR